MRIEIARTAVELDRLAADAVCAAVRAKPGCVLGLPSGATPLGMYAELALRVGQGKADFSHATAFAIDELHGVRRDHPATNRSYFDRVAVLLRPRALHVMDSETPDSDAACARFAALLETSGGLDLAVLGIGRNGHLAFNEPGSAFDSRARRVALTRDTREVYAPQFGSLDAAPAFGLTLGMAELLSARRVLLLASGADKAAIVARALEGPVDESVPASALQRHTNVLVVLDREAAAGLRQPS